MDFTDLTTKLLRTEWRSTELNEEPAQVLVITDGARIVAWMFRVECAIQNRMFLNN